MAYIHDQFTIKKILDSLGLSPPKTERPPPDLRYVPLDHQGGELDTMSPSERTLPSRHRRL